MSDGLYRWSSLRSEYLGEANLELASEYAGNAGFAPGWAWDPYFYGYTWLPGDGLFWNPFGWGFYSPYYIWGGGFIYGRGFRGGFGYGGGYGLSRRICRSCWLRRWWAEVSTAVAAADTANRPSA